MLQRGCHSDSESASSPLGSTYWWLGGLAILFKLITETIEGSEETKTPWANPDPPVHHAIALWAASCAERALPIFEKQRPGDDRPRAAIEAVRAWERGELPMTACRTAAFAAHAAARDATTAEAPAAVAAARAAGQACAVAHMFDHSPHAATYAAKAVGLDGSGIGDRETERVWQWESLAPELRPIGFPKGL